MVYSCLCDPAAGSCPRDVGVTDDILFAFGVEKIEVE